jgi:predicted methyltransferase
MKNKVLLLHIIESNGNVKQLIYEGFTYKGISQLLETLVIEELVIYENQKIKLTDKGHDYLKSSSQIIKKQNKDLWIKPKNDSKIPVMDKDFIFLPNQDELHF